MAKPSTLAKPRGITPAPPERDAFPIVATMVSETL